MGDGGDGRAIRRGGNRILTLVHICFLRAAGRHANKWTGDWICNGTGEEKIESLIIFYNLTLSDELSLRKSSDGCGRDSWILSEQLLSLVVVFHYRVYCLVSFKLKVNSRRLNHAFHLLRSCQIREYFCRGNYFTLKEICSGRLMSRSFGPCHTPVTN